MAGADVTQRLAVAALTSVVPPQRLEAVLSSCGRVAQRVRALPPWVTAYHVLVSAMCPSSGYDDVTDLLWSTLPAATGRNLARQRPSRGAITRARLRLGVEPVEFLLHDLLSSGTRVRRLYLAKVPYTHGRSLWWSCDGDSGALRGCDLRGDDVDAAVQMVSRMAPEHVVVCSPGDGAVLPGLRDLGTGVSVTVGELPDHLGSPWTGFRVRSSGTWAQDALARACVTAVGDAALRAARALPPTT